MKIITMASEDTPPYFNRNKCYFRFNYFDSNYEFPSIETYIYLGNALEMKEKIPIMEGFLYFQDAESFANHGFLNSKRHELENDEMRIWQISEAEAKKKLLNFDQLIQVLKECKN
ncbi:hypothetical protein [Methylomarinum vadi]|uniref:hypothetical protein n=1 Tax=Methylomarinum vadi TaxID=438855 RepID=UPI0004DF3A73|nr:hypothetical protein [Methylomarinum vadi]